MHRLLLAFAGGLTYRSRPLQMRDQTIVTVINPDKDSTTGGPRKPKDACLVVIYGQDLGRKYNITGGEITVGRATSNDICLSQDAVSREHAKEAVKLLNNKIKGRTFKARFAGS